MSAMTALQKMSGAAEKLSSASDLMQNSANTGETAADIKVKEKANKTGKSTKPTETTAKAVKEKGQPLTSRTKSEANAVQRHNMLNQKAISANLTAANDSQEVRQDKQIALAQQQALSMKQLHSTMQDILRVLERDKNKITPKTQEFAKSKGFADIVGEAKNGMIDKIGSLLGDLMGDFKDKLGSLGDLIGGGKEKGGKKRRSKRRDRARAKRREAARIRRGEPPGGGPRPPGGGWWSGAGQRIGGALRSGASTVREGLRGGGHGRGVGGLVMKAAGVGAAAYGGSKVGEWLNGKLGGVSASEESGKGGVGTVSTGKGDNGGVSYGTHQLSSKTGTMTKFLQSPEGQPYAQQMSGLQPGSAAFTEAYKKTAANDGAGFAEAQEKFIARTHYAPQERKVSEATGMDFSKKGKAVQEMLYSTGVQYGPSSGVVAAALKGKAVANMSDTEIINTVQDYKAATVGRYFSSSSGDIQASIANRAMREKSKLLAVDKQALEAKAAGDDPSKTQQAATAKATPMSEVAANAKDVGKPTNIGPATPSLAQLTTVNGVKPSAPGTTPAATEPTPEGESSEVGIAAAAGATALTAATLLPARAAPTPGFAPPSRTTLPEPTVPKPSVVATPMSTSPTLPAANEPHMGGKGLTTGVEAGAKTAAKAGSRGIGSKILPGANIVLGGLDAYDVVSNEESSREEKERALTGVGGGMAGAWAGGAAGTAGGAAIGAGIGSLFFGVGAVPGAAIGAGLGFVGGAAGSYLGYTYGSDAGEAAYDAVRGTPEEQAAAAQAKAGTGVVAGSTPLMMLTQQKADETGDPTAVKAAAAMKTVDEAIKKATSAATVVKDENKKETEAEKAEAKAAAAPITPAALPPVESSGAVASSNPQTPGDMNTMLAGAATTGVAAGLAAATPSVPGSPGATGTPGAEGGMLAAMTAGLGLPPGWAASIAAGYSGATAVQAAAMAGNPPPAQAAASIAGQSMLSMPNTPSANATVSAPTPTSSFSMPAAQPAPPVVTTPAVSQPVAPTSPASADYYRDTDISPSASALAAKAQVAPSTISRASNAPTTVSSASAAPQPIERQQYEPVKSVMMIEPKQQDTMMPQRFSKEADKIPSKGVSEGGSIRQTIDDCPAVISDQGLVLLQTGFI